MYNITKIIVLKTRIFHIRFKTKLKINISI